MSIKPHRVETLISEADVRNRLKAIARELDTVYATGEPLVMVGLLRGSFIVQADLSRAMQTPHEVDFMVVSSYGNSMESSREVKVIKDLETEIHDKHVLVVEDIIDTGNTLREVTRILSLRDPLSLRIMTLLDKPERREVDVDVQHVGFTIPDEFVVGMGIDYAQQHRHLPYIGRVVLD